VSASLVSAGLRARVRGMAEPVAAVFGRVGLTPNHLTVIGFLIACVAAVVAAGGAWLAAGILVLFGAVFDLFDGALARATGRASKLGAFLDSTLDRAGEAVVYLGIAWGGLAAGLGGVAFLAGAAMAAASMVSYTRAKSESLGFTPGNGMASVGLAPREVRVVLLTLGLVAGGLLDPGRVICPFIPPCFTVPGPGPSALAAALGLIAVLATVTTVQRILHVRAQAKEG
jgi:CDP-diacylglycerol--glycerol-3-phosphate 3-phosphatidyltransferase